MEEQQIQIRENLVNTAVKFLQNPKVSTSPLHQKQEFLRRKGLTDKEIQKACDLASIGAQNGVLPVRQMDYTSVPMYIQHPPAVWQNSLYLKIKEFFNATAIVGATLYCIYQLYKKFVEPFLFGKRKKDKDPVEVLDKNIQKSMNELKESINKVKGEVQVLTQNQAVDPSVPQLVQDLKQDLASLKSLLLSRKQFPSAPASIPSWQLEASSQSREKAAEREDDAGSGSSTNNSDSSLEMIREDPPKE